MHLFVYIDEAAKNDDIFLHTMSLTQKRKLELSLGASLIHSKVLIEKLWPSSLVADV